MTDVDELVEQAGRLGEEHGRNAASWYFDGNTSDETYRAVLKGLDDGDPAVLDTLPSSPLSGEWADDPTPTSFAMVLGLDAYNCAPEVLEEICNAYEQGFDVASVEEIERAARAHV